VGTLNNLNDFNFISKTDPSYKSIVDSEYTHKNITSPIDKTSQYNMSKKNIFNINLKDKLENIHLNDDKNDMSLTDRSKFDHD